MIKMINGVIHGRNIELKEDLGLSDGQQVRVQVLPIPPAPETNRLIQSAGMLADEWATDDDRILNTLRSER